MKQNEKWITLGDNNGPCHMHINSELIKRAEFVKEQKPEKISYSVRFFDENDHRRILYPKEYAYMIIYSKNMAQKVL